MEGEKRRVHCSKGFPKLKCFFRALEYISKLEFASAESNMEKYGGILMQNLPGETVAFLKLLCTDYRKSDDPTNRDADRGESRQFSNPDNYLRHFFKRPQEAIDYLEHIVREVVFLVHSRVECSH